MIRQALRGPVAGDTTSRRLVVSRTSRVPPQVAAWRDVPRSPHARHVGSRRPIIAQAETRPALEGQGQCNARYVLCLLSYV